MQEIEKLVNLHIRELLTKIEHDGDITPRLRGRIMNAMHYLAAEVQAELEFIFNGRGEEAKNE